MNSNFKIKLLQNLSSKKRNEGFTLIELLVVIILIGILAAIALPSLLGQLGKGRSAEAKTNLGAINRAEQAYNAENQVFAPTSSTGVKVTWNYYSFTDLGATAASYASFTANALTTYVAQSKNYVSAVAVDTGGNTPQILCEALDVGTATAPGTPTYSAGTLSCVAANSKPVK